MTDTELKRALAARINELWKQGVHDPEQILAHIDDGKHAVDMGFKHYYMPATLLTGIKGACDVLSRFDRARK